MQEPIDRSVLNDLEKKGGSELKFRAIDQFLDKIPKRMEAACDRGRSGDLTAVETAIHAIKSAAGSVGATEVSEFADRIEQAAIEGAKDIVMPLLCQLDDMLGHVQIWLQKEKAGLPSMRGMHWH